MTYRLRHSGDLIIDETDNPITASRRAKAEVRQTGRSVFVHYGRDCRMYFMTAGRLCVGIGHAKGLAMEVEESACDFTEEEAEAWMCGL